MVFLVDMLPILAKVSLKFCRETTPQVSSLIAKEEIASTLSPHFRNLMITTVWALAVDSAKYPSVILSLINLMTFQALKREL